MSNQRSVVVERPHIPVPRRQEDWVRKNKAERTLNDYVEDLHNELKAKGDEGYLKLLDAVWDSQAVEGNCGFDNAMAALRLRELAKTRESPVANEKLDTIAKSLGVVLRRYAMSRKQRRQTVAGEFVNLENGE